MQLSWVPLMQLNSGCAGVSPIKLDGLLVFIQDSIQQMGIQLVPEGATGLLRQRMHQAVQGRACPEALLLPRQCCRLHCTRC